MLSLSSCQKIIEDLLTPEERTECEGKPAGDKLIFNAPYDNVELAYIRRWYEEAGNQGGASIYQETNSVCKDSPFKIYCKIVMDKEWYEDTEWVDAAIKISYPYMSSQNISKSLEVTSENEYVYLIKTLTLDNLPKDNKDPDFYTIIHVELVMYAEKLYSDDEILEVVSEMRLEIDYTY